MAGDLERFLQQAAERLKQKLEQANQPPPPPRQPPPVRQAERARPSRYGEADDDVVEASVVPLPREAGPNPLSDLDTRPGLAQQISMADEKMADRIHDVFDHSVSKMEKASSQLDDASSPISQAAGVQVRSKQSSPFVQMLRNPETLRAAFIASEIFSRRF